MPLLSATFPRLTSKEELEANMPDQQAIILITTQDHIQHADYRGRHVNMQIVDVCGC